VSLNKFCALLAASSHINRIFQYTKSHSGSSIPHKIWVVWPILHYITNSIEANRIKTVIINPDVPLLADGWQFAMGMAE